MTTPTDLVRACLAAPSDMLAYCALGDRLEEDGDPRAALVRLVPALAEVPRSDGPRDDVPCQEGYNTNGRRGSSRKEWPALMWPTDQGLMKGVYRSYYMGLHNLGRLFLSALLRHLGAPDELLPWLSRFELYNCRLLAVCERDALFFAEDCHEWFREVKRVRRKFGGTDWALERYSARAIEGATRCKPVWSRPASKCRAGSFGCYRPWIEERAAYGLAGGEMVERGTIYSSILDLHDAFARLVPWEAAREAHRQLKARSMPADARRQSLTPRKCRPYHMGKYGEVVRATYLKWQERTKHA